jgi:hypothetical protein
MQWRKKFKKMLKTLKKIDIWSYKTLYKNVCGAEAKNNGGD